jgi:hypothetical protein
MAPMDERGCREHGVDHVVDLLDQGVNVFTIERRDERDVEQPEELDGQFVPATFESLDQVEVLIELSERGRELH